MEIAHTISNAPLDRPDPEKDGNDGHGQQERERKERGTSKRHIAGVTDKDKDNER